MFCEEAKHLIGLIGNADDDLYEEVFVAICELERKIKDKNKEATT